MESPDFANPIPYRIVSGAKARETAEEVSAIDPKIDPKEYSDALDYALSSMASQTL